MMLFTKGPTIREKYLRQGFIVLLVGLAVAGVACGPTAPFTPTVVPRANPTSTPDPTANPVPTATRAPTPIPLTSPAVSCSPQVQQLPCGSEVEAGKAYPYQLYTHCGIRWAYFDGRWWSANPTLDDGSHNPPTGWGNPFDEGTMKLVSEEVAVFTNHSGKTAEFKALPRDIQGFPGEACD